MQRAFWNTAKFIETFRPPKSFATTRFYTIVASPPVVHSNHVAKSPIRLRDYQDECIQAVLSHLDRGQKRLGVSLATGSGKTVIFTQLIDRFKPLEQIASQSLILVHRRELVEQAARHCSDAYPSKSIEVEMGNLHATGTADITIASVQSITSGDRMLKFDPKRFKLILVDEAHHIVAAGYMDTLRYFGVLNRTDISQTPALVGVSATFSRFDGLRLSDAIDHIVYHKDYIDMIGEKWLADVIFTTVESKADLSKVKRGAGGDFQLSALSMAVNTKMTNEITFRAWMERATERKSTLVFCVDVEHVKDLTDTFRNNGVDARYVTGNTAKRARSEVLDAFKAQEYPILINCGVFTEGTDIPNIDCVLLARPTKSRNLLVQMIGRGMRLHPGKTNCHIIDMVASLKTGVVTTPTLFGLDPAETVKEADVAQLEKLRERKEAEAPEPAEDGLTEAEQTLDQKPISLEFTDYETIFDLVKDSAGERHVRTLSPFAWVHVGHQRFVLSTCGDFITIERASNPASHFTVSYTRALKEQQFSTTNTIAPNSYQKSKSPYMRPREIAKSDTFQDAVHAADTFATGKYPWKLISHAQPWRRMPATEGQLKFLNTLQGNKNVKAGREQQQLYGAETITKGKAGDMITKFKFGAKGYFARLEAAKRRDFKAKEKKEEEETRDKVKVGPMSTSERRPKLSLLDSDENDFFDKYE